MGIDGKMRKAGLTVLMGAFFLYLLEICTFASASYLMITEVPHPDDMIEFITDTYIPDITGFAVGNNQASPGSLAWIENDLSKLWYADIACKGVVEAEPDAWYYWYQPIEDWVEVTWLKDAPGFEEYYTAFLYLDDIGDTSVYYLPTGTTPGFWGIAKTLQSPFAAYSESLGTITGETYVIPISGTFLLLGTGLIGLVTLGIKKKMA